MVDGPAEQGIAFTSVRSGGVGRPLDLKLQTPLRTEEEEYPHLPRSRLPGVEVWRNVVRRVEPQVQPGDCECGNARQTRPPCIHSRRERT